MSASKEVGEECPEYNWNTIAADSGGRTTWRFCPSGSQWRNGATEVFVKKFKRSLKHKYSNRGLNLQEFTTALKRIACILNSRPIYATAQLGSRSSEEFLTPLTPNMLLLGRSDDTLPPKQYIDSDKPLARLEYVSELENVWWNQYKIQEFSSLVPTQKWKEDRRNTKEGDIVLIQYSSKSKAGEYRLGRVVSVEIDSDDLVRTVVVNPEPQRQPTHRQR